jgi:hypothetical protein
MDEADIEMIYIKTINDISKKYGVSLKDAHLIYSGKSSGLSPEVQKKIKADSLDPNDQIILKELRELRAIVDSEDRTRPSDPPLGPQKKTPTKRKINKDSAALNAFIIKHATKPLKVIVPLAQKRFPKLEINNDVIRTRKYRLRNSDKLI